MVFILAVALTALTSSVFFFNPFLGLLILISAVTFDFPLKLGMTIYSNEFLLLGALLGFGLNLAIKKAGQRLSWWVLLAGVPYAAAIMLSGLNANSWGPVCKALLHSLEFILVIWLAENLLLRETQVRLALKVFLCMAVLMSLWGIGQTFFQLPGPPGSTPTLEIIGRSTWFRAAAGFGHPNPFAGYLLLPLTLLWMLLLFLPGWQDRIKIGAIFLLLLLAFLLTLSRTSWVSFFIVATCLFFTRFKLRYFLLGLVVLEGLFILTAQPGPWFQERLALLTRIHSLVHFQKTDAWISRQEIYSQGLEMWKVHPLLGWGAGTYTQRIEKFIPRDSTRYEAASKHIHNLYLQIMIETGLLGLLAFVALLAYVFVTLWQGWRQWPPGSNRLMLAGVAFGALAFLLQNFFDMLMPFSRGTHFGLWLGLGLGLARVSLGTSGPAGSPVVSWRRP